jgi:UDP-GlcNAc:undecaprenyl-phosphate GlcNAc-1-phosphate transferase
MFLGDSGSLLIGFIISFILIYSAQQNLIHPILVAWSVTIFAFEFISLNIIRARSKKDIFEPNQDHLHHVIFIRTKSIFLTNFFISSTNIILFLLGYYIFLLISPLFSLILYVFFFLIFFILRIKFSVEKINIKIK